MSYQATVLNVMIASPSDVPSERKVAVDVIHEWNAVHSKDRGIMLAPIMWESHSHPKAGERPQEIINKQILGDCDILVAILWTRLGTPTGKSESGTVEEITEHISNNKPALVYFSSAPVVPDSIDAEQYGKLTAFKKQLQEKALYSEYDSISEFKNQFSRHLAQTIITEFSENDSILTPEAPPAEPPHKKNDYPSEAGQQLLSEAAKDPNGQILYLRFLGGSSLSTNNTEMLADTGSREEAKWNAALNELENLGLIEDRAGKRELYYVTYAGYEIADSITADSA